MLFQGANVVESVPLFLLAILFSVNIVDIVAVENSGTFYEILGLEPNATSLEIRKSFRGILNR